MVVQWANSAYDKLRGYAIESYIILNTCNPDDASMLSRNIVQLLGSLGEHISKRLSDEDIAEEVCSAMTSFKSLSDHDLLNMHEHDASKDHDAVMQAYELLAPLAFIGTPRLCPYYVAKWAKFCLHHRVASEHIPGESSHFMLANNEPIFLHWTYSSCLFLQMRALQRLMFHLP